MPDLESRLRAYLANGANRPVPSDLEDRILARRGGRRPSWLPQVAAAAAIVVLAVGVGFAFHALRSQRTILPAVSPSPSVAPSAKPTPGPTPVGSSGSYPLTSPVAFHMINSRAGWAMGTGADTIFHTTDSGVHWEEVSPAPRNERTVGNWAPSFLDANRAWFASASGPGAANPDLTIRIWFTTDGGTSWGLAGQMLPDQGWPKALQFVDSRNGLLMLQVGAADYPAGGPYTDDVAFYRTSDGGATWVKISEASASGAPGQLPLHCAKYEPYFLNGTTGWVTGTCGRNGGPFFYVTRDGGRTWQDAGPTLPAVYGGTCDCAVQSLAFADSRNGSFLFDGTGTDGQLHSFLFLTHDGGRTWQSRPVDWAGEVSFIDGNRGWLLYGKGNVLYRTSDGGAHWSQVGVVPSTQGPIGLQFVDDKHGWVLGSETGGYSILVTADGGATWSPQAVAGPMPTAATTAPSP